MAEGVHHTPISVSISIFIVFINTDIYDATGLLALNELLVVERGHLLHIYFHLHLNCVYKYTRHL